MATFFSTSATNHSRDLTAAGNMSHHHYYNASNSYSDSATTGGLIPLPATIVAHGGDGGRDDDPAAAFVNARDGPSSASGAEMGLQTQLLMANAAAAQSQQQGLSLSLGTQGVPVSLYQQQQQYRMQGSLLSSNQSSRNAQSNIYVQSSRYLKAARELLDEVVNVKDAIKRKGDIKNSSSQGKDSRECNNKDGEKQSEEKAGDGENEGNSAASELTPSERQDLQNKVSALMALLDQVDRKYRHYHHQMQIIMSSFDAVAGADAARPYTALALQTISRHFRSLRDAIGAQVQSLRRSLGEKDASAAGAAGGGLSRLRYIDQHLRQQRAMQQFGMMQQPQHAWRPQRGLPESAVSVLRAWLFEHFLHPYPKDSEKQMLARQTGLSRGQVSNWFINARVRLWKPMIEEMYKEEFGAEMDSHSSSENNKGNKEEAISSEDHDEFQSPLSAAKHHHLSSFKSEASMGGPMDTAAAGISQLSGLDGAMGAYTTSLNLSHHHHHAPPGSVGAGTGSSSLLQDAFAHHHGGGDAARFVSYGDIPAGHLGDYDSSGSVSLTLGLQHCDETGGGEQQGGLLYGNAGDFVEFMNGGGGGEDRQRFGSSQLLHDFVA